MGRLNKPEVPGYRYRSPGQTNARDLTPNLREDVGASQSADTQRIRRGLNADAASDSNRRKQQEAGGRAIMRTAGRAGLAGAALKGGYDAGRALDESTGIGRKMVDKAGSAIDRAATGDRVKLTKEARQQLEDEENFQGMVDAMHAVRDEDIAAGKNRYAKGGSIRGGGCERRGKTRGKFV